MFGSFERLVALRYLRSRRQEGFISVIAWFSLLGIGLGVATLIIVMSVMNGFRTELLTRILGLNGHASVHGSQSPMTGYNKLAIRIGEISGVLSVTPQMQGQVMAMVNGAASGAIVRGVRAPDLVARRIIPESIVSGSMENFTGGPSIIVGSRLARQLRVGVGDKMTLISPTSTPTAFGSVPRMRAFTIVALFNVGMFEYDNSFIYMPLDQAQLFFKSGDTVNAIEVMVGHPDLVDAIRNPLALVIGDGRYAVDWKQKNSSFFKALQVERNVMFLILTLIILVAAFNIISSMMMMVNDKRGSIAIMRTMGASQGMITRIFFMSGASVGLIGTVFGSLLGLLFCWNIEAIRQWLQNFTGAELFSAEIYFLSTLPAEVDVIEVVLVVAMALFLSLAASIYPSWRAARMDPVEALRNG